MHNTLQEAEAACLFFYYSVFLASRNPNHTDVARNAIVSGKDHKYLILLTYYIYAVVVFIRSLDYYSVSLRVSYPRRETNKFEWAGYLIPYHESS